MSTFRPMLAADISDQLDKLRYPVYATPKLDGVRAIIRSDGVWSRSMKPIPNKRVQALASNPDLWGLDGELIVGSPTALDVYRVTQSTVARADADVDVKFMAFDYWASPATPYTLRAAYVQERAGCDYSGLVEVVPARMAHDEQTLLAVEDCTLDQGYEGLILRSLDGAYKQGRSTVREQGMLKLKRFVDGEAEIIGAYEEQHNGNKAKTSALGLTERSSHKAGMVGKGRMGGVTIRDLVDGRVCDCGSGFTALERERFWAEHVENDALMGRVIKYKHFAIGAKDKQRFPVYLGMREAWDR